MRTPEQLHREGVTVSQANKADRPALRLLLFRELVKLTRAVMVKATYETEEDFKQAVDDIITANPSLKVEEILLVFQKIRFGKVELYGRLDTPTICSAIAEYDGETVAAFREAHHREQEQEHQGAARSFREIIDSLPEARPTFAEILARRSKLTPEQRAEIAARDKERNAHTPPETGSEVGPGI